MADGPRVAELGASYGSGINEGRPAPAANHRGPAHSGPASGAVPLESPLRARLPPQTGAPGDVTSLGTSTLRWGSHTPGAGGSIAVDPERAPAQPPSPLRQAPYVSDGTVSSPPSSLFGSDDSELFGEGERSGSSEHAGALAGEEHAVEPHLGVPERVSHPDDPSTNSASVLLSSASAGHIEQASSRGAAPRTMSQRARMTVAAPALLTPPASAGRRVDRPDTHRNPTGPEPSPESRPHPQDSEPGRAGPRAATEAPAEGDERVGSGESESDGSASASRGVGARWGEVG